MNVDAQALGRAVLNDDARAGRPSMAMIGMRRLCFVVVVRRLSISAQIIFFPAQGGGGARKGGAGLR